MNKDKKIMDIQKNLISHVNFIIRNYSDSQKLRAVTAFWKEEEQKVYLSFYFDGLISDDDLEDAYDIGAGVIANFQNGLLEEKYIRLDYPQLLPTQFLAYKRDEK